MAWVVSFDVKDDSAVTVTLAGTTREGSTLTIGGNDAQSVMEFLNKVRAGKAEQDIHPTTLSQFPLSSERVVNLDLDDATPIGGM